jgi:hypothetical protein
MTARARAAAIAVVIGLVLGFPLPAGADPTGGGELGPDYIRATASDLGAGTFPGAGLPARAPSGESAYRWEREYDRRICVLFTSPIPPELEPHVGLFPTGDVAGAPIAVSALMGVPPGTRLLDDPSPVPPDAIIVGTLAFDIAWPQLTDGPVLVLPSCPSPGAAPPWEAPSPAEIWQETPLPRRPVNANPPGTVAFPGITRLTTYVWSDPRPATGVAVSLRGFDVNVMAWPVGYAWSFGDGNSRIVGDPSLAADTYTRRGDYPITLYVVWEARARIVYSAWDLDLGVTDLGTVTIPESLPYHVAEIRSVLRSNPKQ